MAINELIMRTSDAKKPLSTRKCLRSTMRGGGAERTEKLAIDQLQWSFFLFIRKRRNLWTKQSKAVTCFCTLSSQKNNTSHWQIMNRTNERRNENLLQASRPIWHNTHTTR